MLKPGQIKYTLTPKSKMTSSALSLWPHLIVIVAIAAAWILGVKTDRSVPTLLYVAAGTLIACSIALIVNELLPKPEAYNGSLLPPGEIRP
jgi:hypothetical protein